MLRFLCLLSEEFVKPTIMERFFDAKNTHRKTIKFSNVMDKELTNAMQNFINVQMFLLLGFPFHTPK